MPQNPPTIDFVQNDLQNKLSTYHQPKDIAANLKHGVLTLHIHCGEPFEQDDEEEVPVAFE